MRHLSFLLLGIFFSFGVSLEAQKQFDVDQLSDFENYLKTEIDAGEIAGAEVLIFHNQEKVWHKALGYNSIQTKASLEKNSIYFIQSMTKPIMSVAIMQLIEKGLLSLDDLAQDYLPELAKLRVIEDVSTGIDGPTVAAKEPISIRQLLTHTAGLSHGLEENLFDQQLFKLMYNDLFDPTVYEKLEEPVAKLLEVPLIGQPGEQWYYSAAPDILALILQKITQQPINAYLKENILLPLEMTETGYNVATENLNRVMQVHLITEEGELVNSPVQAKTSGNTVYGGTYGLFSSTEDYLHFCQMILNKGSYKGKRILSEASVLEMTKNQVGQLMGPSRGFGLGFGVLYDATKDPSPASTGQIYWGGYFKTHFFIDPSEELIAIFMTQKIPNTNEYIIALNRAVYGALKD
ncbi:MAG: serine hydrolase domain-containing protein [Candidatus Arcticimaribacter sp.]